MINDMIHNTSYRTAKDPFSENDGFPVSESDLYPVLVKAKLVVIIDKFSIRIEIEGSTFKYIIPFDQISYVTDGQIVLRGSETITLSSNETSYYSMHYGSILHHMFLILQEDLLWIKYHFAKNLDDNEYHVFRLNSAVFDYDRYSMRPDRYRLEFLNWEWEQKEY